MNDPDDLYAVHESCKFVGLGDFLKNTLGNRVEFRGYFRKDSGDWKIDKLLEAAC